MNWYDAILVEPVISSSGTIDDVFGAVNALFTSLAFAFLIYIALSKRKN